MSDAQTLHFYNLIKERVSALTDSVRNGKQLRQFALLQTTRDRVRPWHNEGTSSADVCPESEQECDREAFGVTLVRMRASEIMLRTAATDFAALSLED
jgi:hypothetical protein